VTAARHSGIGSRKPAAEPLSRIARDPAAFEVFYREHVSLVTRFVARRVADPHAVADLTADVFLAVIASAHAYRSSRGSPVAWLYGIARNIIAGERRRAAHETRAAGRMSGRRLALAAAASAALAAGVAVALTATSGTSPGGHAGGGHPATGAPGHPVSFGPATTAAEVLDNAALAALELPAGAPRPDQFVYTKLYRAQQSNGVGVLQTWLSADGTQAGLMSAGTPATTGYSPGCRNGWYYYPNDLRHTQRCSAAENAAYFPDMPTSPGALRAWLLRHLGGGASYASGLVTNVESMMTTDYLLPRQRAVLYEVLAQTPGLTVVPKVTNVRGVAGVGIRAGAADKGSIYTIIFNARTYAPLGMNWTGTEWSSSGPVKTTRNGEVLLELAIVDKLGQRP
jgi:hypothetical protein